MELINKFFEWVGPSTILIFAISTVIERVMRNTDLEKSLETNLERFCRLLVDYVLSFIYVMIVAVSILLIIFPAPRKENGNIELWQVILIFAILWACLIFIGKNALRIRVLVPRKTYFINGSKKYIIEKTLKKGYILLSKVVEHEKVYSIISYEELTKIEDIQVESLKDIWIERGRYYKNTKDKLSKVYKIFLSVFILVYVAVASYFSGIVTGIVIIFLGVCFFFWCNYYIDIYVKSIKKADDDQ
ncbi:TPA: hypothetical protein ON598_002378 [Enterococcus faecalis]|nr:hypothetical protein [Enterococcus faecalis]